MCLRFTHTLSLHVIHTRCVSMRLFGENNKREFEQYELDLWPTSRRSWRTVLDCVNTFIRLHQEGAATCFTLFFFGGCKTPQSTQTERVKGRQTRQYRLFSDQIFTVPQGGKCDLQPRTRTQTQHTGRHVSFYKSDNTGKFRKMNVVPVKWLVRGRI